MKWQVQFTLEDKIKKRKKLEMSVQQGMNPENEMVHLPRARLRRQNFPRVLFPGMRYPSARIPKDSIEKQTLRFRFP